MRWIPWFTRKFSDSSATAVREATNHSCGPEEDRCSFPGFWTPKGLCTTTTDDLGVFGHVQLCHPTGTMR